MFIFDPYYAIWSKSLLLDGESNLEKSLLKELQLYFGISEQEAKTKCLTAKYRLKRRWGKKPPNSPQEILNFYTSPNEYPFDLIWWHTLKEDRTPLDALMLLQYGLKEGMKKVLDFGCGVGSHALVFAKHGFEVTLVDVSPECLRFAKWRFKLRNLSANFILSKNPEHIELPKQYFDAALAFDVLEHVIDPLSVLKSITTSIKIEGLLCINFPKIPDIWHPMHIHFHTPRIEREMTDLGLMFLQQGCSGRVYRKIDHVVTNGGHFSLSQRDQLLSKMQRYLPPKIKQKMTILLQMLCQNYTWLRIHFTSTKSHKSLDNSSNY